MPENFETTRTQAYTDTFYVNGKAIGFATVNLHDMKQEDLNRVKVAVDTFFDTVRQIVTDD